MPLHVDPENRPRVSLSALKLADFRNYASLSVRFDGRHVVLTGDNGAGKTNLLEAISLLSPGRGLRRAAYSEMARAGAASGFAIHARVMTPAGEAEIGTAAGTAADEGDGAGRRVRIDGTTMRSADALTDILRVAWLTPAMDGLFTGPGGDRRRFLDRMVLAIDPAHGRRAADYERAMRGRNRLLAGERAEPGWLDALERQLAELGAAIIAARTELVRLLAAMIDKGDVGGPFPRAEIAIDSPADAGVAGAGDATDLEDGLARSLRDSRSRDRAAGRTLTGPHRSDLAIRHGPKDMPAGLCSTGEQKALLVGLVVAHARLVSSIAGSPPVLLLDEIGAHLDEGRRTALFDLVDGLGGQCFMTGTDRTLFSGLGTRAQFLTVSGGQVEAPSVADR